MDFSKLSQEQMDVADLIVKAATVYGVDPNLLLAQAFQESKFRHIPNGITDAFGVMQIRPGTAEQNKLGDITDLETNINGGAKLMKQYLDKYKSPEAALIAYHQGPGVAQNFVDSGGDPKGVGQKGRDYVIKIGDYGGFNQSNTPQNQDEQTPNPFGDVTPLPKDINAPTPNKRPNLADMPDFYQKGSRLVRNPQGDISGGTLGTAGAVAGAGASLLGNKGLAAMESQVNNAKTAYEAAKAAAQGAAGASADTVQKLTAQARRLEQDYRSTLFASQKLEGELAQATAESKRFLPPDSDVRTKVTSASGAENYARKMPGQLPPEAMLSQVEDMTTGKNARGMGAGDIAARNAENIATQKRLGLGDYKMTGTGSEQLILSPAETARRQAQMDAATARIKQLAPQVSTLQAETDAAFEARKVAENIRQREVASAQRAAREALTAQSVAQTGVQSAVQAAPSNIGKIGAIWQKIPGANILGGLGAGLSAAEALNRYEKGDNTGAVISTIQLLFDGMSMLPPGTPITAALKGIGVVGGLAVTAGDMFRTHMMESQKPPQPNKARGGLALMN